MYNTKTPTPNKEGKSKFQIVGAQEKDSLGTENWKIYLDGNRLLSAWVPPIDSPYASFVKIKTIMAVSEISGQISPRYSDGEVNSEKGIDSTINAGLLGNDVAVVLDSGGPHSVAMAIRLATRLGYQPIIMFDNIPDVKGSTKSEQDVATMLYFAGEIENLKNTGTIRKDGPPVFVLDTHRDNYTAGIHQHNNGNEFNQHDFPSAKELLENGIKSVVYLNEGDQGGRVRTSFQSLDRVGDDLKPIITSWEKAGIKIVYTGVRPWPELTDRLRYFLGIFT